MIAYKHVKDNALTGTLAVQLPKLPTLVNFLNGFGEKIDLNLGVTLLHPKDNFCKKIGREKSVKNMKNVTLHFNFMTIMNGRKIYAFTFETEVPKDKVIYGEIEFSEIGNSSSVHLENVYLSEG